MERSFLYIEAKELAEVAKKQAELSKKLETAERKLKIQQDMLEKRVISSTCPLVFR